jgi:lipopolysaccharide/colanic/teichoic acid biosynthesis glycosyltransferase
MVTSGGHKLVLPTALARDSQRRNAKAGTRRGRVKDGARRIVSLTAAAAGLVLAVPVALVIAAIIKLTSPGPVLFVQHRVGVDRRSESDDRRRVILDAPIDPRRRTDYGGQIFKIYKFRTMRADADLDGQMWATPDDPRITPIGRFLRLYRLDELPQLINVLRGEMNLVGPRPEQPEIFRALSRKIDGYAGRQRVLPGITGLAQVSLSYDRTLDDVQRKTDLDLEYIERRSVTEDLRIMLRTIPVVVLRRGSL